MTDLCQFEPDGERYTCVHCGWSYHQRHGSGMVRNCPGPNAATRVPSTPTSPRPRGPGDYLHAAILRLTGEDYATGCGCNNMVHRMNAWGPTGCRAHLDDIAQKILTEAAARRKRWKLLTSLPGAKFFIKLMIRWAIRKSEQKPA